MTTVSDLPQYENKPVILVHLLLDEQTKLAACAPYVYTPNPDAYPDIPRVLCMGCYQWGMKNVSKH